MIAIEPQTPESGDIRVTMLYDYMGRRVEKKAYSYNGNDWVETGTKHFLYDGWNLIKETTTENSTTTTSYYTWGLDLSQSLQGAGGIGGLIATVSDTDTNYHCYDLNGNKTQLISEADGTITAHVEYDPFGNDINSYGLSSEDDPFRFSTKYHDPEYDLYYYGYRYYVPDLGRWLTRDPIGEEGGLNLYCYISNSVVNSVDVLGEFELTQFWICFASCFLDVDEEELEAYRDGDIEKLSREKRRKIEKKLQKKYKDEMKNMTKKQKREFKRRMIKQIAKREGIEFLQNKFKRRLGSKASKKLLMALGGTVTGGLSTLYSFLSGASDIYEICNCVMKCKKHKN